MSLIPGLSDIQGYYQARINDLKCFSKYGTPWDFVGGAMLIEWLANLAEPPDRQSSPLQHPYFVDLVTENLAHYAAFEFQTPLASLRDPSETTLKYLPLQLYLVLRNPLVHSFSMLPTNREPGYVPPTNPTSYRQLDRSRSIVMCHRGVTSTRWDGEHLALVEGDRCQLRSPDFLEDLDDLVTSIFSKAGQDPILADRIHERFNRRRPVDTIGNLEVLRLGPTETAESAV
ncbi:MAG TPA: hypothetical protein V6C97_12845 [Oculatellaceae cyanobacterium]